MGPQNQYRGNKMKKPNSALSYRLPARKLQEILKAIWGHIGSPLALTLQRADTIDECLQLLRVWNSDPNSYSSPASYFFDAQSASLLSKGSWLRTSQGEQTALEGFLAAERHCSIVNERLSQSRITLAESDVESILFIAQRKIASWLAPHRPFGRMDLCRFGPGASFGISGDTSTYAKLSSTGELTAPLLEFLPGILQEFPGLGKDYRVVQGSRITFVPKNYKTDRTIGIEPSINGFLQLGLGTHLKEILLFQGCNLYDQSRNQRLAQLALTEDLTTLDLKSASDCLAYNAVASLLPTNWFQALDLVRSPAYTLDGGKTFTPFAKFSAMGNGYTFELESMIFYAIALSACAYLDLETRFVSVYGDDIIIPSEAMGVVIRVLSYLGFQTNTEKTFTRGSRFFESCGRDFFDEQLVRPVYLTNFEWTVNDVYQLFNKWHEISSHLVRLSGDLSYGVTTTIDDKIIHAVPSILRIFGPKSEGRERAYFHDESRAKWSTKIKGAFPVVRGVTEVTPFRKPSYDDLAWYYTQLAPSKPSSASKQVIAWMRLFPDDISGYSLRAAHGKRSNIRRQFSYLPLYT